MVRTFCIVVAIVMAATATPLSAQILENAKLCERWVPKVTADAQLEACNALIASGVYAGNGLSEILVKRGHIYFSRKGDPARALEDFDRALSLNPQNSAAFYFRSLVRAL